MKKETLSDKSNRMCKRLELHLKAGDKVYIWNKKFKIEEKIIHGVVLEKDEIRYQLDKHQCGSEERTRLFLTKKEANEYKKDFFSNLNYKIGDIVVIEKRKVKVMAKIIDIKNSITPYELKGMYEELHDVADEEILFKIKDSYIKNFENIKSLLRKYRLAEKRRNKLIDEIGSVHNKLETELNDSIRKKTYWWNRDKPLFKDRFSYERERFFY